MRKAALGLCLAVLLTCIGCCTLSNECGSGKSCDIFGMGGTPKGETEGGKFGGTYRRRGGHNVGPIQKWLFGNLVLGAGPVGMIIDVFTGHAF